MIRLLGEVATIDRGHSFQKQRLMDGLCEIIGADRWATSLACRYGTDPVPVYVGFSHGGFTEDNFARFLVALEHPDMPSLNAAMLDEFRRHRAHLTRRREQIDVENRFPESAAFPLWIAAGLEHLIMSIYPLDEISESICAVYRRPGSQPFTARESRILHIMLSEVPWLHALGWPEDRGVTVPALTQRQRLTLNLLLEGHSRKLIADHLGISIHTVGEYIQAVYRHFKVQSQRELIARFRRSDGGDQFPLE
jgi:DNA-binding CsgD family transcriptional regulator